MADRHLYGDLKQSLIYIPKKLVWLVHF